MDITYRQTTSFSVMTRAVGDICAAECVMPKVQKILVVVLYISPNQRVAEIKKFQHFDLLPYTSAGSAELQENYDQMPTILRGDFNVISRRMRLNY